MIPKGLFTQIAMIVVSVGILITYVQPTFGEISSIQDDIEVYEEERAKVSAVNQQLAQLVERLETVSAEEQRALLTYIPNEVDAIAVPRDLQFIAEEAGVLYKQVSYLEVADGLFSDDQIEDEGFPVPHAFSVEIEGTYSQIKDFLELLEQNNYPLEVHEMNVQVIEGGILGVDLRIVTYSHLQPKITNRR